MYCKVLIMSLTRFPNNTSVEKNTSDSKRDNKQFFFSNILYHFIIFYFIPVFFTNLLCYYTSKNVTLHSLFKLSSGAQYTDYRPPD